ncbi:MAG: hypothetical protein KME42_28335 [Tildeniella nuda ZEHNDER 1965/U140]|nr:hypothetical protein [Tildeniella nuda ZEHNDER 1965/U140]
MPTATQTEWINQYHPEWWLMWGALRDRLQATQDPERWQEIFDDCQYMGRSAHSNTHCFRSKAFGREYYHIDCSPNFSYPLSADEFVLESGAILTQINF